MIFKKNLILLLIILSSITSVLEATDAFGEVKAGYFYPPDHRFRKIFSNGGGIYGIELNCQIHCNLYAWTSANYFCKSGFSIGEKDRTRVTLVPVAAGLKYFFPINCVNLYIGAGILATYLHTKNHSPFVIRNVSKWGVGGIWKIGSIINVYRCFFIDLFADYSYMKIPFSNTRHGKLIRHDANVSGISAGGGVGFCF